MWSLIFRVSDKQFELISYHLHVRHTCPINLIFCEHSNRPNHI